MHNKSINLQRTQSLLIELISEALSKLNDNRINSLVITEVDCKHGKYDANVYFDGNSLDDNELKIVKQLLSKASGNIKSYCLNVTGWYKCPNFTFINDEHINKKVKMESLFTRIENELKAKEDS